MDQKRDEKTKEVFLKPEGEGRSSDKIIFVVIVVFVLSAVGAVFFYRNRGTERTSQPPSPYTLTPSKITTAAGATQSFTAAYPVSGGWRNLSDASIYVAGGGHDQWVHYNPVTKGFTLAGVTGSCTPGQAATLSNNFLIFNCSASSVSGSDIKPTVTFSLTPQTSFSGAEYRLVIIAFDQAKASSGSVAGTWTVK